MMPVIATGSAPTQGSAPPAKGVPADAGFDGLLADLSARQGGSDEAAVSRWLGQDQAAPRQRRPGGDVLGIADAIAAAAAMAATPAKPSTSLPAPSGDSAGADAGVGDRLKRKGDAPSREPRIDISTAEPPPTVSNSTSPFTAVAPLAAGIAATALPATPPRIARSTPPCAVATAVAPPSESEVSARTEQAGEPAKGAERGAASGRPDAPGTDGPQPAGLTSDSGGAAAQQAAVALAPSDWARAVPAASVVATTPPVANPAASITPLSPHAVPDRAASALQSGADPGPDTAGPGVPSVAAVKDAQPRRFDPAFEEATARPTEQPTPSTQVAAALRTLVDGTAIPGVSAPPAAKPDPAGAPGAAPTVADMAKAQTAGTLAVTLSPDHLGPVAITMQRRGDRVEIRIKVASPEALRLLEQDRHVLAAVVDAAKHDVVLQPSGPAAADVSGGAGAADAAAQGALPSPASAGDGQPRRFRHADHHPHAANPGDDDISTVPTAPGAHRDGSLYV